MIASLKKGVNPCLMDLEGGLVRGRGDGDVLIH